MSKLSYRTIGNENPQRKPNVYFSCHPDDFRQFFDEYSTKILRIIECAIWYESEPEAEFDKEGLAIMEIRKLIESDYDMVVELYKELDEFHVKARPDYFVHREKQEIYPKDAFVHNLSHPGVLQLGAFENEQLVGVVRASLWEESGMVKDVNTVCLDTIYVLPAYRRKGIAKRLFADVESWAKEQGAVRLDLHTWDFNKNAIAMYRAMGMTPQSYVFEKKL